MGKFLICFFAVTAILAQAYSQTVWTKDTLNNPVLPRGTSGQWDSQLVENPYVLFDGTGYHMWYAGGTGTGATRIGYAYSSDGINNWAKQPNPVLEPGPSGSWDDNNVLQPSVIFDGNSYHMWFGGTRDINDRRIGYATSPDSINWTEDPYL
jgi:predicted GH43/DUF377 family glycosyl hydrolase